MQLPACTFQRLGPDLTACQKFAEGEELQLPLLRLSGPLFATLEIFDQMFLEQEEGFHKR